MAATTPRTAARANKRTCLTKSKPEARRVLAHMNEACRDAQASEQIAHVYMNAADAQYAGRTWQDLFELIVMAKRGNTRQRWERAIRCRGYDPLRL